ncbi:glycoside hydrolase family 6 protein [Streptomyces mangrovisoli]|uniref:Glucanase n=1 Tax=Streptomyces mangrovisoli TaxID=1428628 RepID=A0A1J4NNF8_9ACTN|nr:glycoside hydrolase family 6 protein [Streptomyces mangrovisoli]OIJ63887.1 glycoside hydrolase [Streptomyces mangrovisoli]
MLIDRPLRRLALAACAAAVMVTGLSTSAQATTHPTPGRALDSDTRFYVDPHSKAAQQALTDLKSGDLTDARTMAELATWPEAIWLTDGTPGQVATKVRGLMRSARAAHSVPVLVLYNVPGRDCSSYSAGGAADSAAYHAWVNAVADAIGASKAVVVVEPDSLALLPRDCGPDTDPTGSLTTARIADVRSAVTALEAQPATSVYLDAGTSNWQPVGEIAGRLIDAGLGQAQGFALNVSNYQPTDQLNRYATWISKCVWYATKSPDSGGRTTPCASQYYSSAAPNDGLPGDAVTFDDTSTWHWTDAWYDSTVGSPPADELTHYVLDTSRNGRGAWTAPPGKYTDDEHWCNAPGRGVGDRPTADTRAPLADAYLYVKIIGESDGTCHRGTAGPGDPEYGGVEDPPAGAWWPDFAHTLARNANPPLTFNFPH